MSKLQAIKKDEKLYSLEIPYSETEHRIGTWTDGKPLYRRVFNVTNLNYGSETILAQITNSKDVFIRGAYIINSTTGFTIEIGQQYTIANRDSRAWADAKSGDIKCYLGSAWNGIIDTALTIVEYTKTTD